MEKSEKQYKQLSAEERATIMRKQREGSGLREMGRFLKRSPSPSHYAMPRGDMRRELMACLRWSRDKRRSEGRGHLAEMQSIHLRPLEEADRLITGHWEADRIKGAMNRSSIGARVERTTRRGLAKVPDGTAQSALDGFGKALSAIPPSCAKPSPTTQGAR